MGGAATDKVDTGKCFKRLTQSKVQGLRDVFIEAVSGLEEDAQTLTKLGLNCVQARVYLSLIRTGPAKAKQIASASNVARPDVYRTLSKLQEMGLVEKIVTTPVKFKALSIVDALHILFKRREIENFELKKKAAVLFRTYREIENTNPSEVGHEFVLIPKKEPIVLNMRKLAENARKHIYFMIPLKKLLPLIINYSEIFENTIKRNVNVQILTEKPEKKDDLMSRISKLNLSPHFELRMVLTPLSAHFGIYDNKKILLSTSAKSHFGDVPAIYSNNMDIIELAKEHFETAWITAIETKEKIPPILK